MLVLVEVGKYTWVKTIVSEAWGASTLRSYLTHRFKVSKVWVEKSVRTKKVTINGMRPTRAGDIVKPGDTVAFRTIRVAEVEKSIFSGPLPPAPEILFKDPDILAINKPADLPVQGGDNRVIHLGAYFEDKDVTGALLLARTRRAAAALSRAFNPELGSDPVEKTYLAIVWRPIRYNLDGTPSLVCPSEAVQAGDKASRTVYWLLKKTATYSLVALRPLTGRKHQLRLHLAKELGLPIVGDPLYQDPALATHAVPILLHCFCMKIKVSLRALSLPLLFV
ncbi:hypothetical protein L0F63_000388 [Massospora cicadina]|nr:hypothetical protein L0F63_000388 [Massospora cicadina]